MSCQTGSSAVLTKLCAVFRFGRACQCMSGVDDSALEFEEPVSQIRRVKRRLELQSVLVQRSLLEGGFSQTQSRAMHVAIVGGPSDSGIGIGEVRIGALQVV